MKKYFIYLMSFMMTVVMGTCLAACGGDEDEGEGGSEGSITSSSFVGKWSWDGGNRLFDLKSGGKCDYYLKEYTSTGRRQIESSMELFSSGTWRYLESSQILSISTSKVNFNYEIVNVDKNTWIGRSGNSIITFTKE